MLLWCDKRALMKAQDTDYFRYVDKQRITGYKMGVVRGYIRGMILGAAIYGFCDNYADITQSASEAFSSIKEQRNNVEVQQKANSTADAQNYDMATTNAEKSPISHPKPPKP